MSSQTTPSSSQNHFNSANPVGEDGQVRCRHNVPLQRLTSKTTKNFDRQFYTCFKEKGNPDHCGFFKWVDDLFPSQTVGATPVSTPGRTPTSLLKRSRESDTTPITPNVSPSKISGRGFYPTAMDYGDDDDFVNILSDDEVSQFHQDISNVTPPAKRPRSQTLENTRDDTGNPFCTYVVTLQPSVGMLSSDLTTPGNITKDPDFRSYTPKDIERLHLKLVATEKSRDKKAERIGVLEKEIRSLKAEREYLEEQIQVLRAKAFNKDQYEPM